MALELALVNLPVIDRINIGVLFSSSFCRNDAFRKAAFKLFSELLSKLYLSRAFSCLYIVFPPLATPYFFEGPGRFR